MNNYTATYSPDDNKLRLYCASRLPADLYARVKAAGFRWAPKQELFVAPAWTPQREDLLLELLEGGGGEIEDEDKSPAERAEERAERFGDYREHRTADAHRAAAAVQAIADGIPLGQPILIGHHSEKHARRDQEKIERGMAKAVKMWDAAQYWTRRAAGAIHHAKYKELPAVRARRIKTIETDQRKTQGYRNGAALRVKLWTAADELTRERALTIANASSIYRSFPLAEYPRPAGASQYEGEMSLWTALKDSIITPQQARDIAVPIYERSIIACDRWLSHYAHRLAYERAMLAVVG